jgi:hypothetical protein
MKVIKKTYPVDAFKFEDVDSFVRIPELHKVLHCFQLAKDGKSLMCLTSAGARVLRQGDYLVMGNNKFLSVVPRTSFNRNYTLLP